MHRYGLAGKARTVSSLSQGHNPQGKLNMIFPFGGKFP